MHMGMLLLVKYNPGYIWHLIKNISVAQLCGKRMDFW